MTPEMRRWRVTVAGREVGVEESSSARVRQWQARRGNTDRSANGQR
jgi:hypothetical protein